MRNFISVDMEGITGLVDRDDAQPGGRDYQRPAVLLGIPGATAADSRAGQARGRLPALYRRFGVWMRVASSLTDQPRTADPARRAQPNRPAT
ncbi:M55 family metallopeptidase [Streptomyces sp. NPDC094038]|uniref:M55 family metallopeptidase n=1 Tax=Streptomyces sp. NPDC094038 TaxID=3366055 RepID=UPI0038023AC3